MLNYIWSGIVVLSVVCAALLGNTRELSEAVTDSGAQAVALLLKLAGMLCLWSGIMKIAQESGFTRLIARVFAPLLRRLFPRLDPNSEVFGSISMNISANLLGLGNTATPFGLKAMRGLHLMSGGGDRATDEMIIFVVMNTASLQLLPTMLSALRQSYGSKAPFEILVPVWISSACALATALIITCVINKINSRRRRI